MQQKTSTYGRLSIQALQHRRRCESLPPLQKGEAELLVAQFVAAKGITECPTRYVLPVEQRPLYARLGN
jgi:hypothetical protein